MALKYHIRKIVQSCTENYTLFKMCKQIGLVTLDKEICKTERVLLVDGKKYWLQWKVSKNPKYVIFTCSYC